jgi:hypothetical protein
VVKRSLPLHIAQPTKRPHSWNDRTSKNHLVPLTFSLEQASFHVNVQKPCYIPAKLPPNIGSKNTLPQAALTACFS